MTFRLVSFFSLVWEIKSGSQHIDNKLPLNDIPELNQNNPLRKQFEKQMRASFFAKAIDQKKQYAMCYYALGANLNQV